MTYSVTPYYFTKSRRFYAVACYALDKRKIIHYTNVGKGEHPTGHVSCLTRPVGWPYHPPLRGAGGQEMTDKEMYAAIAEAPHNSVVVPLKGNYHEVVFHYEDHKPFTATQLQWIWAQGCRAVACVVFPGKVWHRVVPDEG